MQTAEAVESLIRQANDFVERPIEIITEKAFVPPDGDKRSFVSLATYCWPSNPEHLENPKGPWECRDGSAFTGVRYPASSPVCPAPLRYRGMRAYGCMFIA